MKMILLLPLLFIACQSTGHTPSSTTARTDSVVGGNNPYQTIAAIPPPAGFSRPLAPEGSFTSWLRALPLRSSKTVFLYNGIRKENQEAQFAVLDIRLAGDELEQCADVVMHLRTAYLAASHQHALIAFSDNAGSSYLPPAQASDKQMRTYLRTVFAHCGTASLEKQLPRISAEDAGPGDVLIRGGAPGHAMIIVDMAINTNGQKAFLLAQGYMPAQDIHIVVNPAVPEISPWYRLDEDRIQTPEWTFYAPALHTWTANKKSIF